MNHYSLLRQRQAAVKPVRPGAIGAGKRSSMILSRARLTPGMKIVGIAEFDVDKAILPDLIPKGGLPGLRTAINPR